MSEPYLFISYARADIDYVRRLVGHLTAQQVKVWWDAEIPNGERWESVLQARVAGAAGVLLVESPAAQDSEWVGRELQLAQELGKPLLLVLFEGQARSSLAERQYEPAFGGALPGEAFIDQARLLLAEYVATPVRALTPQEEWDNHHPPEEMVARPQVETIAAALTSTRVGAGAVAVTGLQGGGGLGKTVVAQLVVSRPDVRAAFPGGLLWASIGQDRRGASLAPLIGDLCVRAGGQDPGPVGPTAAGKALLAQLARRPATLVVLDDVWFGDQVEPFGQGQTGAARILVTTRNLGVVEDPRATMVSVELLDEPQARQVLLRGLPPLPEETVGRLLAATGGWAIVVNTANAQLRHAIRRGSDPAAYADMVAAGLEAVGPRSLTDRAPAYFAATMKRSLDVLPELARRRAVELAVFAEDTDIPLDLVTLLWAATGSLKPDDSARLLGELRDLNLLTELRPEANLARMHDLVRGYLTDEAGEDGLRATHAALLDAATTRYSTQWWELPVGAGYLWGHLIGHLFGAGRETQARDLLTDLRWAQARLLGAGGAAALDADLATVDDPTIAALRSTLRQQAHLLGPAEPADSHADILAARVGTNPALTEVVGRFRANLPGGVTRLRPGWTLPDAADPALLRVLTGHTSEVRAVAIGRAGDRDIIVSGSDDHTVRLWDAATGTPIGTPLEGHTSQVRAVAIGRAGDRDIIVSGSADGTVRLWDAATGAPIGTPLGGHSSEIVSGSDRIMTFWVASTGTPIGIPMEGTSEVRAVAIGRAGNRDIVVSGGADHTVRLWDAATSTPIGTPLEGHTSGVGAVAIGRAGDRDVIVSGDEQGVRRWDPATGARVGTPWTGHTGWVGAVAIGRAGNRDIIVSGAADHTVRLWDPATGTPIGNPLAGHTRRVWAVAIGRAGNQDIIVSGSADGTVRLWNPATDTPIPIPTPLAGSAGVVLAVAIGRAGGRDIIVSGGDRIVRLWDAATGAPIGRPWVGSTGGVRAVAIGRAGGRDIIVSGGDRIVRLWDAATGALVDAFRAGPTFGVHAVAIGRTGDRDVIVTASRDYTVRLWDAATATPIGTPLTGHTSWVAAVAIGRAGDRDIIVSGSTDHTLRLWDAPRRGRWRRRPEATPIGSPLVGHTGGVKAVAISRAGDRDVIVSGSSDHTVRLWDPATGALIGTHLTGHTGAVTGVTISPDGTRLASAGADATLRVWDAVSGACLMVMRAGAPLTAVAWSRDGRRLYAGGQLGLYRFDVA